MRRCSIAGAWVIASAVVAQDPIDTSAFRAYMEAYRAVDERSLMDLSLRLAAKEDAWLRDLSLLSLGAYQLRSDDIRACLSTLDSLDGAIADHHLLLRANSLRVRALALKRVSVLEPGLVAIQRAIALIGRTTFEEQWVDMVVVRAEIERRLGRLQEALEDLNEAERIADRLIYAFGKANVLINRGNIFYSQDRLEEAWNVYSECLQYSVVNGFSRIAANAIMNLGSVAHRSKRYEEAIHLYDSLYAALGVNNPELRADLLNNNAFAQMRLGRFTVAEGMYRSALELNRQTGNESSNDKVYQLLATNLWEQGKKNAAFDTLMAALRIATANGLAENREELLIRSARWNAALGRNVDANQAWEDYKELRDSLDKVRFGDRIAQVEIQYETEKKDQRIKLQELELAAQEADLQRHRARQWVLGGALLALALIGGLLYRNQSQKRALAEHERTISEQKVEEVLRTQELKLVNAMVEGQELERKRIAQDLHDRLGSMLSAIKLRFSALEGWVEKLVVEQQVQFKHLFQLLDDAVSEVRRVSHDMAKSTVTRFGLGKALEELRASIAVPDKLEVELNTYGLDDRIDPKLEVALYRMVQEMVSNVLKHARAAHLSIQVTRSVGAINLLVEDDGSGFDPASAKEGMGMGNLRSRAAEFKGVVHVDSKPGRGTSISIDIPLA